MHNQRFFLNLTVVVWFFAFSFNSAEACDLTAGVCPPPGGDGDTAIYVEARVGSPGVFNPETGYTRVTEPVPPPEKIKETNIGPFGAFNFIYDELVMKCDSDVLGGQEPNNYNSIAVWWFCPAGELSVQTNCAGGPLTYTREGTEQRLKCSSSIINDDNQCGNSAGDPFDTLTGEQMDRFVDLPATVGLPVARTYTTFNEPRYGLHVRKPFPEALPWYNPFGAGWFWDYGIFFATKGAGKNGSEGFLFESNGLRKSFHRYADDRLISDGGDGEAKMSADRNTVVLSRGNGQRLTFVFEGTWPGNWNVWKLIEIYDPQSKLTTTLTYVESLYVSEITTDRGQRLTVEWNDPWSTLALPNARYKEAVDWDLRTIRKLVLWSGPSQLHSIDYSYEEVPDRFAGHHRQLVEVKVDGALRHSYVNEYVASKPVDWYQFYIPLLKRFSNARGTDAADETVFDWSSHRGSYMTGADGLLYSSAHFNWTHLAEQGLEISIFAVRDRTAGEQLVQKQTFTKIRYRCSTKRWPPAG